MYIHPPPESSCQRPGVLSEQGRVGRGLQEMPGEGHLGKSIPLPTPPPGLLAITAPSPGGENTSAQSWPQTGGTCLATRPGPTPQLLCPPAPPGHCRVLPEEFGGHLTNPLMYRGETETQGGDACLRGALQTRGRLALNLLDLHGGAWGRTCSPPPEAAKPQP